MGMRLYIYIYLCLSMSGSVYISKSICLYIHKHMRSGWVPECMCIYIYTYLCLCLYLYLYLIVYVCIHAFKISDRLYSDRSQSPLNIRPAPGKSWFSAGPYKWWEYDYNFLNHGSLRLNLFSHTPNTKHCAIRALTTCLMRCLHLAPVHPACLFPHWKASRCLCEPNRKNATKSVPTNVLIFKIKTLVGTDLVAFFRFGMVGSQNQLFDGEVGGWGRDPKKMYGERLGDGVEYHLMKPTPRR